MELKVSGGRPGLGRALSPVTASLKRRALETATGKEAAAGEEKQSLHDVAVCQEHAKPPKVGRRARRDSSSEPPERTNFSNT